MCSSPRLIAACHDLLRLLMPRHSPCALSSLTSSEQMSLVPFPPCGENSTRSIAPPLAREPAFAGLRSRLKGKGKGLSLRHPLHLVLLFKNYADTFHGRIFSVCCFYPFKVSTTCFVLLLLALTFSGMFSSLFSFQGATLWSLVETRYKSSIS